MARYDLPRLNAEEYQAMELWHNMFRMHGYVEAALNDRLGGDRPALLRRADALLKMSFERMKTLLPGEWYRFVEQPVHTGIPGPADEDLVDVEE